MPGSLKSTCATNTRAFAYNPAFATLNSQDEFSVSFWYQVASIDIGAITGDLAAALSAYPFGITIANQTSIEYQVHNHDNSKQLTYMTPRNSAGHFVVISYDGDGTSTIYHDGSPVATATSLGNSQAANQILEVGYNHAGVAITVYEKDLAIWVSHALGQSDVLDLRDGAKNPATLGTSATHWWTLQSSSPTGQNVTVGSSGLHDQLGGVDLNALMIDLPATLTYDAHEIVLIPSVRMLNPYVDVTGNLIVIPLYLDSAMPLGGPATPTIVNGAPTFKLNGSTIVPTLVPILSSMYAILYEMPSRTGGVSCGPGDVLTMAAPLGWASTTSGSVEGTSAAGLGSGPLTLINNAHARLETAFQFAKTMKIGYDAAPFANANNYPGQPRANYASRCPWKAWSGGLTYHANGLPATISGGGASVGIMGSANNKIDSHGSPDIEGLWTLPYGDSSTGVSSSGPNQIVDLTFSSSWIVTPNPNNTDSPGHWDGAQWTGVIKTYYVIYSGIGGYGNGLRVSITSGDGTVNFPDKGSGQVEFGIFPPSPADRNVSSPTTWDPLAVDPEYLLKLRGARVIRWLPDCGGFGSSGDSSMLTVADLVQRQVNDFLWTKFQPTVTANIIRIEPIGSTFDAIIDYQGGTQTMSSNNWTAASLFTRCPMLFTTDSPHGLRTGDPFTITTPTAPAPAANQTGFKLASTILIGASSPVTFTTSSASPPVVAGRVILIGTEQFTVVSSSGSSVTATRGTPQAHAINDPIYLKFLTGAVNDTSDPVTITISDTTRMIGSVIQIDSEQMTVTGVGSSTSMTVSRSANGTTKASHSIGAVVYPCLPFFQSGTPCFVTSPTQFVLATFNISLPAVIDPAISNPTVAATVNYTAPNQPLFTQTQPPNGGSVPYEFAVHVTDLIATDNGFDTICQINFAFLVTDELVTYVFENICAPAASANPHMKFIAELSNEIWNGSGPQFTTSNVLALTAPNPESGGTGFPDGGFIASRQNHITRLAKAAFTAASLDPARVYNFQPGRRQVNPAQSTSAASVVHCQTYGIPIDYLSPDGYVDITTDVWSLWWSWMPTTDGGTASWSRPVAMRVMMSYFRAWCHYSQYLAGGILGNAQLLSWYAAGKDVSANGIGTATANTGLGNICYYEASVELVTGDGTDVTIGGFIHADAMEQDLVYDGRRGWAGQWVADVGWAATEEAYFSAKQSAAATYAAKMPSASFPDMTAATADFTCYVYQTYVPGSQGQMWYIYRWQGQQPGTGASNTMMVPDGTAWSSASPVVQDPFNVSVRAQASLNWIAATDRRIKRRWGKGIRHR